jgi:hypothetical protein
MLSLHRAQRGAAPLSKLSRSLVLLVGFLALDSFVSSRRRPLPRPRPAPSQPHCHACEALLPEAARSAEPCVPVAPSPAPVSSRPGLSRCASGGLYLEPYRQTWRRRELTPPFVNEDAFRALSDWLVDLPEYRCVLEPAKVACGDVIFVKTDFLDDFLANTSVSISQPFVLVTHASDMAAPNDFARDWLRKERDSARRVAHWFALNVANDHPDKMTSIPLGMLGPGWHYGRGPLYAGFLADERALGPLLRSKMAAFLAASESLRRRSVIASFSVITNRFERQSAATGVQALGIESRSIAFDEWPLALRNSSFVFSPQGNGFDTHRLWEVIVSGAVPIVRAGQYDALLACLPHVAVVRWEDLEWAILLRAACDAIERVDAGLFDFRRAFLSYHAQRIEMASQRARLECNSSQHIIAS